MLKQILKELKNHSPFTIFGAITGITILLFFKKLPFHVSYNIFYILHPTHVFLSALVTASMYKLHECKQFSNKCIKGRCNLLRLLIIGYIGSIGIATISDSIIPYLGEILLNMPNREIHIGFIEEWWLINPLAILGITIAYLRPMTKISHAGHVLLSTWASLFHIIMATGKLELYLLGYFTILIFLFLAVWLPCCLSDIIFPLLFIKK